MRKWIEKALLKGDLRYVLRNKPGRITMRGSVEALLCITLSKAAAFHQACSVAESLLVVRPIR